MKKFLWVMIPLTLFLISCENNVYRTNDDITKYAETQKYFETLKKENVKFLKCYPSSDGKEMVATYTTIVRDNDFPATIRFDFVVDTYNVYFDNAYLNGPKDNLKKDIDDCFTAWKNLQTAQDTWK